MAKPEMISFTFDQFRQHVDRYISRRVGVGLDDLADVDIWDYYIHEAATVADWKNQISDAALWVMESQDCVDDELMSLFE
jgi:hypothetical protein